MKQLMPKSKNCFCCGTDNPAGLNLDFYFDENKIFAEFIPDKKHGFSDKILNTGVAFGVLVEAMGWLPAQAMQEAEVFLADFNARVLSPAYIGKKLFVEAESVMISNWISEVKGYIKDEDGNVCIKSTGKYIVKKSSENKVSGHTV